MDHAVRAEPHTSEGLLKAAAQEGRPMLQPRSFPNLPARGLLKQSPGNYMTRCLWAGLSPLRGPKSLQVIPVCTFSAQNLGAPAGESSDLGPTTIQPLTTRRLRLNLWE